ncbi:MULTISPECIES: DUF7109 family protein [Halomicrobium]|uniref:Uncharacterized protein n=2 Tax=Halomicrobium mukohataei TaxID=57705 RepID=C7P1N2_HALMD|nr:MULTISPECIES: hypothetical protein [Halomicrobium]ACV49122.1 conserved hypothetical protein [Halomicrobium mukohataei DSM 12286]QCD64535.1 hypothetical protein E5139_02355 [Halomicrobium mukohataei]QFR19341.1 hypothetical protein GBQ70_02355 [Halomicrobium sp. ZPS1]
MEPTADELAGVVDLFGALTRDELVEALSELAFKRGEDVDDPAGAIDDAVAAYHLAVVERDGEKLLAAGPAAFPELPDGATDLPHIMDVPERSIDRERLAAAVEERFREESLVAVRSDNEAFVERLLDVSYELEVWGPIDVSAARERLADAAGE